MAKTWIWVLLGIVVIAGIIWYTNYGYSYGGLCRDDHGNYYSCQKVNYHDYYDSYDYSRTYVYYDNYGNRIIKNVYSEHNYDDYYDCYHANTHGDRYGNYLKEEYGLSCRGNTPVNDYQNYNSNYYQSNSNYYSEKAPIIYIN